MPCWRKKEGYRPFKLEVCDAYGNSVDFLAPYYNPAEGQKKSVPINKAVFLKDTLCLADKQYSRLRRTCKNLPSLGKVKDGNKLLDLNFEITRFEGMVGAWQPLDKQVKHVTEKMMKNHSTDLIPKIIGVKLSGDGIFIGSVFTA